MSTNTSRKGTGSAPAPSFYGWQLMSCRTLNVHPDVIRAALDADAQYTMKQAKKAINDFLNREV